MLVISEILKEAGLLDAQIEKKTSDIVKGNSTLSETISNRFSPETGFPIEGDRTVEVINNKNKSILQSDTIYATYKTDKYGNTIHMDAHRYMDDPEIKCITDSSDYTFNYDKDGKVLSKLWRGAIVINDRAIEVVNRRTFRFREDGKPALMAVDILCNYNKCTVEEVKSIPELTMSKVYTFGYDEDGRVTDVTFLSINTMEKDYVSFRANIAYNRYQPGLINHIHTEGESKFEDEFFTYYNDGTISAVKNGCVNGTIVERSEIIYRITEKEKKNNVA